MPPPYDALPVRMIRVVAYQAEQIALWDGPCGDFPARTLHAARRDAGPRVPAGQPEPPMPGLERDWAGSCADCGTAIDWDGARVSATIRHLYDTGSGKPEPGCLYWADWLDRDGRCFSGWTNCTGRHLLAILPNGHCWDIDSRARNCGRPEDTTHRCWVRTGTLPRITVGKGGDTCSAGAGSIQAGDYHGFLTDGAFTASL